MSINKLQKFLLAGTALVAVSAFGSQAQAVTVTATGAATWAESATQTGATVITAAASNDLDLVTFTTTVSNDQTAKDNAAGTLNLLTLGAVTGTTGSLIISTDVTNGTGAVPDLVVNGTTVAISGAGNISVLSQDNDDETVTATFSGAVSTGGNLVVTAVETSTADDVNLTIGGATTVTGTTGITAGAFAGSTANVTSTGNWTSTGATTLTGGAGAGSNATLTLTGATNAFGAGGLNLVTAAKSILTLNGTVAQTVSGVLTGGGSVVVNNAAGATFSNAVTEGVITVEKTAGSSAATFKAAVTATTIKLGGDAAAGTNTLTFDGSTAGFAVAGTVDGTATETDNVVVTGGNTITTTGIWGGGVAVDSLALTTSGTNLTLGAALTAVTNTTLGSGTTLTTAANNVTSIIDGASAGVGTLAATGNTTVTGNIGATNALAAINVSTGATLSATGATVKATTTTLTTTGQLTLTDAVSQTVTGNIVGTTTGTGKIAVTDGVGATTAFVGDLGTSSIKLASLINATGGTGSGLITTTGNMYVDAITMGATNTLQFLGTAAQTVSGTIDGTGGANRGILSVGNGTTITPTVTFSGNIGTTTTLASATVGLGSTANLNGNAAFAGAFTNNGTTAVATSKTLTTVGWTSGAASTLNLNVSNTAGNAVAANQLTGKLSNTGAVVLTGSTINFNVASTSAPLLVGTVASAIVSNVGVTLPTAALQTDNSFLYNLRLVANGTNADLAITTGNTIAATSTTTGNAAVGGVLQTSLAASTNAGINALQGAMASAATAAAANEVLESAQPTVDGSATVAAMDAGAAVQGVADVRMASLRTGDGSGVAAGSSANGWTMWIQGYGQHGNQDVKDGIDGYDSNTWGGAVGVDSTNMMNNGIVGLMFSYGRTNADSNNANTTDTDVNSYGVGLYGNYDLAQNTFLTGQLGYGYNKVETDRHDAQGPGSGVTANGDTHSNQWSAKLGLGRDYAADHGLTLTPSASAAYTHLSAAGFTETGAGGASLNVGDTKLNSFKLGVGGAATWNLKNSDGSTMKPQVRLGYTYETIDDQVDVNSTFVGDAAANSFQSTGASPDRSAVNAGLGVTYMTTANWDLTANYDYTWKANYDGHAGVLRATSHF